MTLKTRLGKLEQPATERWRRAWEDYAKTIDEHLNGILETLGAASEQAKAEGLLQADGELDDAAEAFCARIGVPSAVPLFAQLERMTFPDMDKPDLTCWPGDLAEPPDETPGVWEKLEPYRESSDLIERLTALLYLLVLSHARGRTKYREDVLLKKRAANHA